MPGLQCASTHHWLHISGVNGMGFKKSRKELEGCFCSGRRCCHPNKSAAWIGVGSLMSALHNTAMLNVLFHMFFNVFFKCLFVCLLVFYYNSGLGRSTWDNPKSYKNGSCECCANKHTVGTDTKSNSFESNVDLSPMKWGKKYSPSHKCR